MSCLLNCAPFCMKKQSVLSLRDSDKSNDARPVSKILSQEFPANTTNASEDNEHSHEEKSEDPDRHSLVGDLPPPPTIANRRKLLTRSSTSGTKRTSLIFLLDETTSERYKSSEAVFYGPYAHIRESLDYTYHNHYTKQRQWLQDSIIDKLLSEIVTGNESQKDMDRDSSKKQIADTGEEVEGKSSFMTFMTGGKKKEEEGQNQKLRDSRKHLCTMPVYPWLIYVAGTTVADRALTIKKLLEKEYESKFDDGSESQDGLSRFPIFGFTLVDSREIMRLLPEYKVYKQTRGKEFAVDSTRSEVGYISEVVTRAALEAGSNVLIFGGLKDPGWHKQYFSTMKKDFEHVKISILNIAAKNGECDKECARIDGAIKDVASVPSPTENSSDMLINFVCKIQSESSGENIKILTEGMTWNSFQKEFTQKKVYVENTFFQENRRGQNGFIHEFSLDKSTEENHKSEKEVSYGPFKHLRDLLDYDYHCYYTRERQILQDAIISEMMTKAKIKCKDTGKYCSVPTEPFVVFTAGAMGAGKSYTLRKMQEKERFPLEAFVIVDPDEIRQQFPEYGLYVAQNPAKAGEMTRKEAGYLVEILTLSALQAGKNVLVDGSLRDSDWYSSYFERLRKDYPLLKIMILHIDAPREAIIARAKARGKKTGRVIPNETLIAALEQVPRSVNILKEKVDFYCKLNNAPGAEDIELMTEGITWESFKEKWLQTCAWFPHDENPRKTFKSLKTSPISLRALFSS